MGLLPRWLAPIDAPGGGIPVLPIAPFSPIPALRGGRIPIPVPVSFPPGLTPPGTCVAYDLIMLPPQSSCGPPSAPVDRTGDPNRARREGWCNTVYYVETQTTNLSDFPTGWQSINYFSGPITNVRFQGQNPTMQVIIDYLGGSATLNAGTIDANSTGVFRITRQDGLPDNCSPPGGFGTPPRALTDQDFRDLFNLLRNTINSELYGVPASIADALNNPDSGLADALRRYLDGLLGKPGSGIPGDNDGDGDVDEDDEDKDNDDDDEGCSGKSQLAILKATVDKLYKFLGGKDFGGDKCKPGKTGFSINPESYLRSLTEDSYDFETANGKVTKITTQEHEVETLPQLIAALLSVNYVRSGQYKFPTTVADTIVQTDQGFLSTIFGTKTEVLTDQQSYHQWFLEQFDAILGRWQQKIVIQDSDLEQPGDQEKVIRLPNLAEAISELFVLSFQTKMAADTLLNFNSRLAIESACIKAELFRTQSMVDTLVDYIGAKTKDVKADLPLLFTLTARDGEQPSEANLKAQNSLSTLLEQSKKPIVLTQLAQKETLQSDLVTFRQAAAIIRAALSKNLGTDGNIQEKLMNIVRAAAKGLEKPPGQSENDDGNADLSAFLQEFEQGFIGSSGISDATNPYGRPINQRPQAREIGRSDEDS
jgi:hypothetical protein